AGMVGVPVCVPGLGDLPALGSRLAEILVPIGRIATGGFTALRIVQQEAVTVAEAGELVDLQTHSRRLRPPGHVGKARRPLGKRAFLIVPVEGEAGLFALLERLAEDVAERRTRVRGAVLLHSFLLFGDLACLDREVRLL